MTLGDGNNLKRIRIDILCRGGSQSPLPPGSPRTPLAIRQKSSVGYGTKVTLSPESEWQNVTEKGEKQKQEVLEIPQEPSIKAVTSEQRTQFFTLNLFVAAVGEGSVLPDSGRRKHGVLEQIIRNVSKEQNIVVKLGSEGINRHLKMRVFVQNSIEAKAVIDYISTHPDQVPCPFVVLARKLPIAVSYRKESLDPSCAAVADRLRKQAKTRAVKMLREAIADPLSAVSSVALKGLHGPNALAPALDRVLQSRCVWLKGAEKSGKFVVFAAKIDASSRGRSPERKEEWECKQEAARGVIKEESLDSVRSEGGAGADGGAGEEGGAPGERGTAYFTVNLFVAAVAEGEVEPDSGRKKHDVLEQIIRNVSKEQNTVVKVSGEGLSRHLKMRVFVENSLEAKAVIDYVATHPEQVPCPFVVLARKLPIAVSYRKESLDPSCAAVADRLRKQAKTRAVKMLREAIADPLSAVSSVALKGLHGPNALAPALSALLLQHSTQLSLASSSSANPAPAPASLPPADSAALQGRFIVFAAKNNKAASPPSTAPASFNPDAWRQSSAPADPRPRAAPLLSPEGSAPLPAPPRPGSSSLASPAMTALPGGSSNLGAFFPVSLLVTAIGDGRLAPDLPHKVRDRLEQIRRKIPKEQLTCVEVHGLPLDIKLRVFVTNSEDAKAVSDYVRMHPNQLPPPFVVLARDLPMALLYDPTLLDLSDSSVADRLRKQAKTRAVKLMREVIATRGHLLSVDALRGYHGASAPAQALEPFLKEKALPLHALGCAKSYISFTARSKTPHTPSPLARAKPAPADPPALRLAARVESAAAGEEAGEAGREEGKKEWGTADLDDAALFSSFIARCQETVEEEEVAGAMAEDSDAGDEEIGEEDEEESEGGERRQAGGAAGEGEEGGSEEDGESMQVEGEGRAGEEQGDGQSLRRSSREGRGTKRKKFAEEEGNGEFERRISSRGVR